MKALKVLMVIICMLLVSCGNNEEREDMEIKENSEILSCGTIVEQGDWIYFIDISGNSLYKAKAYDKGKAIKILSRKNIGALDLYDDWIYYTAYSDDDLNRVMLYRVKKDGTENMFLIDYCDSYVINEGRIYYRSLQQVQQDFYQLISCDINGDDKKVSIDNIRAFTLVLHDKIYYESFEETSILRRANLDGTNDEAVFELDNVSSYIITDDYIYYIRGPHLLKLDLDNQESQIIYAMDDLNLEFCLELIGYDGRYIFGTAYKINGIFKIALDDSSYEILYQDMPVETQFYIIENRVYALNYKGLYRVFSDGREAKRIAAFY